MERQADLIDFVKANVPSGPYVPYAYYGEEEDALTVYVRSDADYAKRINSRVTVYLSLDKNELVGCRIKSVRRVLEDIGWFDVEIKHGEASLKMLFLALHGTITDGDDSRYFYRKLGEFLSKTGSDIKVEVPPLTTCS